jgi:hypothetical protein
VKGSKLGQRKKIRAKEEDAVQEKKREKRVGKGREGQSPLQRGEGNKFSQLRKI